MTPKDKKIAYVAGGIALALLAVGGVAYAATSSVKKAAAAGLPQGGITVPDKVFAGHTYRVTVKLPSALANKAGDIPTTMAAAQAQIDTNGDVGKLKLRSYSVTTSGDVTTIVAVVDLLVTPPTSPTDQVTPELQMALAAAHVSFVIEDAGPTPDAAMGTGTGAPFNFLGALGLGVFAPIGNRNLIDSVITGQSFETRSPMAWGTHERYQEWDFPVSGNG